MRPRMGSVCPTGYPMRYPTKSMVFPWCIVCSPWRIPWDACTVPHGSIPYGEVYGMHVSHGVRRGIPPQTILAASSVLGRVPWNSPLAHSSWIPWDACVVWDMSHMGHVCTGVSHIGYFMWDACPHVGCDAFFLMTRSTIEVAHFSSNSF